jgi:hypothetical protein
VAIGECDSINTGKHLNFSWLATDLNNEVGLHEVVLIDADVTKSECIEDIHQFSGILRIHSHEKVDITRVPRKPMQCHRIAADDEVINPVAFE